MKAFKVSIFQLFAHKINNPLVTSDKAGFPSKQHLKNIIKVNFAIVVIYATGKTHET
tara:strand:- start:311 stop:481 length:171 start_codon:yes stop_codon:yes gene_type:complete